MVKGHVWKPKRDGRWHWQLIIREATRHAHVYSGTEVNHPLAMASMEFSYQQHRNPGFGKAAHVIQLSGLDTIPYVA